MAAAQGTDSSSSSSVASTATATTNPPTPAAGVQENEAMMAAAQGTDSSSSSAASTATTNPSRGETRKLFVGGVPAAAAESDLLHHFARFGEVRSVVVMRDRDTGYGRGFGFVEFVDESAAVRALGEDGDNNPMHYICGRQVEVKRARTRPPRTHYDDDRHPQPSRDRRNPSSYESKKLFIGGLRDTVTEAEFRAYFETFGAVTDAVVIYDNLTNKSRGFGFVTFASEESVAKVMRQGFHDINGTKVEAKMAIPKHDDQYYYHRHGHGRGEQSSSVGASGSGYEGGAGPMYQPYYMVQPVPAHHFYPAAAPMYQPVGGFYDGGMMAGYIPPVYGAYPQIYPGFNVVPTSDYGNGAAADVQDVSGAAGVATRLEHMKLGPQ